MSVKLFIGKPLMDLSEIFRKNLYYWTFIFVFVCSLSSIQSLSDVKATLPTAVKAHDTVIFQCNYDLEGEPLYTVKWYKGRMEFFRYMPKEDPSMKLFHVPGIVVDLSRSSPNEIVLLDVQPESTGRYTCEVLTDAPNFDTQLDSGYMYVIDVPEEAPIMEINKENTGLSNTIKANCTTPPSYPAMNVTWYINGIKVSESGRRSVSLDPIIGYSKNQRIPYMTISYVEKEIDENIFQGGVIRVQCISTLFNLYKSENVRYIEDSRPQPWPSSVIGTTGNAADFRFWPVWTYLIAALIFLL